LKKAEKRILRVLYTKFFISQRRRVLFKTGGVYSYFRNLLRASSVLMLIYCWQ